MGSGATRIEYRQHLLVRHTAFAGLPPQPPGTHAVTRVNGPQLSFTIFLPPAASTRSSRCGCCVFALSGGSRAPSLVFIDRAVEDPGIVLGAGYAVDAHGPHHRPHRHRARLAPPGPAGWHRLNSVPPSAARRAALGAVECSVQDEHPHASGVWAQRAASRSDGLEAGHAAVRVSWVVPGAPRTRSSAIRLNG